MRRIVLTFGLIAGGIMSAMLLITLPFQEKIGFEKSAIIGYTSMIAAFLMIYFGVKSYRDNVVGESISFGRAFKVGLLIMALSSALYVATWEVVYFKFIPDFGDRYAARVIERARSSGASEAEIAEKTREMDRFREMYRKPLMNIAFTFLEPLPVGLLVTFVTALSLSRKRRERNGPAITPAEA